MENHIALPEACQFGSWHGRFGSPVNAGQTAVGYRPGGFTGPHEAGAGSPMLYVLGFAGVLLAALLASAAPAWRASRVQPMGALRYD